MVVDYWALTKAEREGGESAVTYGSHNENQ